MIAIGTPVVVVVVSGRVHALPWLARGRGRARVRVGARASRAARRLADVLFGDVDAVGPPADHAPAQRRARSRCTTTTAPAAAAARSSATTSTRPPRRCTRSATASSYTTFEYAGLEVGAGDHHDAVHVAVGVTQHRDTRRAPRSCSAISATKSHALRGPANSSPASRASTSTRARPTIVEFEIDPTQLAYYDEDMRLVIEPGDVRVMIGPLSTIVTMEGPEREIAPERPRPHPNRRQIRSLSERYRRQFAARTLQAWRSS